MWVVKASGETEKFDPRKIKRTCIKAGASDELANEIVKKVKKKVYNGISTRDILRYTLKLLSKKKPIVAARYDLKGAMFRLGPAGFVFEKLIGEVFKEYGYSTKVHNLLRGRCVMHEVDVVASKDKRNYMIECKYHNMPGIYTTLKEALYTYARFLDLVDGSKSKKCVKFDQPWLICNTKFSCDAVQYASCRGMRLLGWSYPEGEGLERLIEDKRLYPITMIRSMDNLSLERLSMSNLILAADLVRIPIKELNNITNISLKKLREFSEEARRLTNGQYS